MIENLSFGDFTHYAQQARLGRLNLPNGRTKRLLSYSKNNLSVELTDLYRLVDRLVAFRGLTSENILAVIAVGSAVLFPGYRENYSVRRKFRIFGPLVVRHRTIPIQPNDIDFFILTDKNLGYDGAYLRKGMLHIVGRGTEQMARSKEVNDTVSMHALREGIPMFFDEQLKLLAAKIGIKPKTPRKIYWSEDRNGCLIGTIN